MSPFARVGRVLAGLAACAAVLSACEPTGSERSRASRTAEVVVFAASSLTDAFEELATSFEASHPGTHVVLVFSGSQVLRLQIEQGARADVFASADENHVEALVDAGLAWDPIPFATNALVIIASDSEGGAAISALSDLAMVEAIAVGTESVPIGRYTRALLDLLSADDPTLAAAIEDRIVTRESNARLVRAKVALGEADAAIVYRTDATAPGVRAVSLPERYLVPVEYHVAVTGEEPTEAGRAFAEYLLGPSGQEVLERHGFTGPDR